MKQRIKRDRAIRRQALKPGEDFRPYDLFDAFSILPIELLALRNVGPGPKLLWGLISKHLGKEGAAFPTTATLATELGTNKRQILRWIEELKNCALLRTISRGRNRSLDFRLRWHEAFQGDEVSPQRSDKSSSAGDNSSSPSSDKLSLEKASSSKSL